MARSVIYRSSAGSGKTFTLIFNYLKILLGDAGRYNPNIYRQILAITFTNKAANEMKSRLIEDLTKISSGKTEASIFIKLQEELNITDIDLQIRAREAMDLILQNYGHVHILTIDSFFQGIIRSFSKELGLPFNYKIEMQLSFVQEAIVVGLFHTALDNKELFNTLLSFSKDQLQEGKNWNFETALVNFSKDIFKEDGQVSSYTEAEIKSIIQNLRKIREQYFKEAAQAAQVCLDKIPEGLLMEDFSNNGLYIKCLNRVLNLNKDNDFLNELADAEKQKTFKSVLRGDSYPYTKISVKKEQIEFYIHDTQLQREKLVSLFSPEPIAIPITVNIILQYFFQLGLFSYLKKELARFREENETLLISDLTVFINKMIENEDIPFIYEKKGAQFQYLLFDEFQDTSIQQWQNIFPLIDHILSQAKSSETKVMLVGDAKQSIYRFRKGEVDLILNGAPYSLSQTGLKIETLNINFRSLENIVCFNNKFFEQFKNHFTSNPIVDNLLSDVMQEVGKKSEQKGYVEINSIAVEKDEDWEDVVLERILENIKDLIQNGNYHYSEICFLVNKNKEGNELAHFLMSNNIPCSSPDTVYLRDGLSVKFILATLRYIDKPQDNLAYTEMAYNLYKMGKLKVNQVEEVFSAHKERMLQQLYSSFFEKAISFKSMEISSLIFKITSLFDLEDQSDVFWMQLLASVQDLERNQPSNLLTFFEWWEKDGNEVKVSSSEGDAVQIMTIHKSKGLQFPVVILPFADWSFVPRTNTVIWMDINPENPFGLQGKLPVSFTKSLEKSFFRQAYEEEINSTVIDNINKLYVALTRPEEQLYIYFPEKSNKNNLGTYLLPTIENGVDILKREESTGKYFIGEKPTHSKSRILEKDIKSDEINLFDTTTHTKVVLNNLIAEEGLKVGVKSPTERFYNEAQEKGIIIHEILQKVDFANKDWKSKVEKNYRYQKWMSTIESILDEYHNNEVVKSWNTQSARHYTERDIYFEGQFLRPDRVILYPEENKSVLVDYKTGEKRTSHIKQMENYINALKSIDNKEVKGFLVYVEPLEIEEVKV